ncbi:MAG: universal stress protein [Gemmatimonadales bacterium]|nr:MAG: universal stress protein [Gemmatimonadales bacterium]
MNAVVAMDFSAVSEQQLTVIGSLTSENRHIYLLHFAEPNPDFVGFDTGPDVVRDQLAQQFHREHEQIQSMAQRLRDSGREATALLVQGPTVDTILRQAEKLEADLIVVGSHGHGAMYDMLVGSISAGVIRRSTVPVLVVPARGS